MPAKITDDEATRRGELLAKVLQLRPKSHNGLYETQWGDKTALGLYRTVARIIGRGE